MVIYWDLYIDIEWYRYILVGGLTCIFPIFSGNVIIPADFYICQRGGPTTNQYCFGNGMNLSEKIWVNLDDYSQNIGKHKTCSKPPTRWDGKTMWVNFITNSRRDRNTIDDGECKENHPPLWPNYAGEWNIPIYPELCGGCQGAIWSYGYAHSLNGEAFGATKSFPTIEKRSYPLVIKDG